MIPLKIAFSRIAKVWPWLRAPILASLGIFVATAPMVFRPSPDWMWLISFFASPVLVYSSFYFAMAILRPGAPSRENLVVSFLLYFATGGVWVASLALGAWPSFSIGRLATTYLVFALAWPPTLMWVLFGSLSVFPMS